MKTTLIACGAVLLTASFANAQDKITQELVARERLATTAPGEKRAIEVAAAAEAQGLTMARVPLESKIVKGAPYSAEVVTESTQQLPDGNRIVRKSTGRVYRDSQGRTRREDDIEPGRVGGISIIDPVAQFAYSLDAASKTAWKTPAAATRVLVNKISDAPADPAEVERRQKVESEMATTTRVAGGFGGAVAGGRGGSLQPTKVAQAGWDEKVETLPAKNIEGVMAEGKRTTRTIPAGAIGNEQPIVTVTEEWRSPELQVLVMTRTSDPRSGESTYRLLNITRAEPNASWFEVPADYTIKESGVRRLQPSIK
ncbi:MAG TPA: hypothetical protein VF147_15440 [Vicinamibacterales bacterium]